MDRISNATCVNMVFRVQVVDEAGERYLLISPSKTRHDETRSDEMKGHGLN